MSDLLLTPVPVVSHRRDGHERGMATVEYAIGVVLVLVIVGAVIVSVQQGWFSKLAQELIEALLETVVKSFNIDLPWAR
ncbi:MAG: hypothetical protein ACLGHZ_06420 [Actinomycetes bacterium]